MHLKRLVLLACFIIGSFTWSRTVKIFLPDADEWEKDVVTHRPVQDTTRGPIPHILWFTYKHNILANQVPKVYYNNIMNTIHAYRSEWNEPDAPVHFLVDQNCTDLLTEVDRRENTTLAQAFQQEFRGDLRADLCRVAALFLHGGYYFDVDLQVVQPLRLHPDVSFSTARDYLFGYFFQAFLAATPGHPILRENLHTLMEFYVDRQGICFEHAKGVVGPCTLAKAWNQTSNRGVTRMLQETHLQWHGLYPNMTTRGKGDACHWVLHDPEERQVYFYSRIPGSSKCFK